MADIVVRRNPGRALTTREPFYRPMSLLDDIERFASDMWESWTPMVYGNPGYALDMHGNDDELVMRAELPGIGKEDIRHSRQASVDSRQWVVDSRAPMYEGKSYFGKNSLTTYCALSTDE